MSTGPVYEPPGWDLTTTGDWTVDRDYLRVSGAEGSTPPSWQFPADGGDPYGDVHLDGLYYNSTFWNDILDGGTLS